MSEYTPDRWVILRIESKEYGVINKLFSGRYGGYAESDTWKLNSGIASVTIDGDSIDFVGESGSVYTCNRASEGMSLYMMQILSHFRQKSPNVKFTIIDFKDYETIHCRA